jgi:hypothetical protein
MMSFPLFKTTPVPAHPPPGPGLTQAQFDQLMLGINEVLRRDTRIETRLCRLLAAHGLDHQGFPLHQESTT